MTGCSCGGTHLEGDRCPWPKDVHADVVRLRVGHVVVASMRAERLRPLGVLVQGPPYLSRDFSSVSTGSWWVPKWINLLLWEGENNDFIQRLLLLDEGQRAVVLTNRSLKRIQGD